MFYFIAVPLHWALSLSVSGVLLSFACIIIIKNLTRSYLWPRDRSIREKYPFEITVMAVQNQHRLLESMYDFFFVDSKERLGECKTGIMMVAFQPPMVFTNSVENITYILKDNFENFGKTGALKNKFQPLLGDGIFNADGRQWYGHRKTNSHLFSLRRYVAVAG